MSLSKVSLAKNNLVVRLRTQSTRTHSLAKALTWRITATFTTFIIAFFITGELAVAVVIGGIEFFVKFLVYYLHERLWVLVSIKRPK